MKKKTLNEVKLDSRIKNALRIINDKLGIQKDFRDSKDLGFEDLEMTGPMMDYIDGLTVDEKKVLIDVIKSITLLTSGNVKSVRTAGRSFDPQAAQPWKKITSDITSELLTYLKFDVGKVVTKRDYQVAKKMLSSLSKQKNLDADPVKKYTRLYRGMSNLEKNTIVYLMNTDRIFVTDESSFSTSLKEAWKFGARSQYNTIFVIDNPEMKGLDARGLSNFAHEEEVIFSGIIKVNKIAINNNRSNRKDPSNISESDFILDPSESVFSGGLKSMILNELPDKEDTFTTNMGIDLPNGERLHRPLFIFHGTVM